MTNAPSTENAHPPACVDCKYFEATSDWGTHGYCLHPASKNFLTGEHETIEDMRIYSISHGGPAPCDLEGKLFEKRETAKQVIARQGFWAWLWS